MKIKCIIIEDEPLATEKLTGFIQRYPLLVLCASFDNALEAIAYLKTEHIDLVFLDIQMEGFTGIQFLEAINQKPFVIITSAYDQYALKTYEYSVDDFLLKPYSFERFVQSVEKIADKQMVLHSQNGKQKEFIFVHTEYRMERIELKNILYIEGMKDYLKIVTKSKDILTLRSFKALLEILPSDDFVRTHKSYVVAISKIENIERNRIKISDKLIPISDTYKSDFYQAIERLNKQ